MGYKYEIAIWVTNYNLNGGYEYQIVWTGDSRIKLLLALRKYKKQTGCIRLMIR